MKALYLTLGVVFVGFAGLLYSVMEPSFRTNQWSNCFAHLKQIGLAAQMYAHDNNGRFPVAANWTDALQPYVKIGEKERTRPNLDRAFRCATTGEFYVLNEFLAGAKLSDDFDPAISPLAFCVRASERNLADDGSLWPLEPIHEVGESRGNVVVFADAHVKILEIKPKFHSSEMACRGAEKTKQVKFRSPER